MSAETFNPAEQLSNREHTIEAMLIQARQSDNVRLKEIPMWGVDTLLASPGEIAMISTNELEGCHTSIIVGHHETGSDLSL